MKEETQKELNVVTFSFSDGTKYALINYMEIIMYYQQPFYKKWFNNPPVKELINITELVAD